MSSSYVASTFRVVRPAGQPKEGSQPPHRQEKRKITAVACLSCQKKRCKCDGKRPICSACAAAGSTSECVFETRGNQSRAEALKEMNKELKDENMRLRELLQTGGSNNQEEERQPRMFTPRDIVGTEASYESPLRFEDSESRTVTGSMMMEELDGVTGLQPGGPVWSEPSPPLETLGSTMSQTEVVGNSRIERPIADPNEGLKRKVARLEEEVERLKAAVWQRPLYSNQELQRPSAIGIESTSLPQDYGTIDPSRITMEPRSDRNITSSSYGYVVSALPFTEYPTAAIASSPVPLSEPTSFTLSNTESSSRITTPTPGLRRRRSLGQGVQSYSHKRRKFGSVVTVFGNLPLSSAIWANHQPMIIQEAQIRSLELPMYLLQILNSEDHCLAENDNVLSPEFASSTFHRFRTYGRRLIANDANIDDVLGPNEIDVQQFFTEDDYILNNHTTSTFAPWFLRAYPSLSFTSKVACALLIQLLLRWQISPTAEHFEAIPEWFRATGCQMFIPHISAFDFIPWPEIRDLLIAEGKLAERQVLIMIISNLVILWPHSTEDVFTWDLASGTAIGVSPRFVEHIHNIDNWAINDKILKHFPYLEGKARFVDIHAGLEQFATQSDRRHRGDKQP